MDVGDGTPNREFHSQAGPTVRLQLFNAIGSDAAILTVNSIEWIDHVVLAAADYPTLFMNGRGERYLSLVFINAAGNSQQAITQFEIEQVHCEVVCGDALRASSENCDDGNVHAGDGCSDECTIEDNYFCDDYGDAPDYMCWPALYGKSRCRQPTFESVRVEDSTNLARVSNRLTVAFSANFDILRAEEIHLRGLKGTTLNQHHQGSAYIPIESVSGNLADSPVSTPAQWDPFRGTLTFTLTRDVAALTLLTFAFTVVRNCIALLIVISPHMTIVSSGMVCDHNAQRGNRSSI